MKREFYKYFISIIILCFIGIFSIFYSSSIVSNYDVFLKKQIMYLIIGVIILFVFRNINYELIKRYCLIFYILSICLLIYVLFFGNSINGSRSWISLFGFVFQPSEFAKIALLICLDNYINKKYGLIICISLLLIPSMLTFLQPDTGTVMFYLVIFFSIFISLGIKKIYYIVLLSFVGLIVCLYFYLYFFQSEIFIDIFGTSFFYRTDRILNFIDSSGYQLNNALIGIGNGGLLGNLNNYIIYIPEAITDFMFANLLMMFGLVGGIVVLICFICLDINLIKDIGCKNKYFVIGLLGLFVYQQIQHIFMNIGLLPITGITLPFVSYGGSSLISYFVLFGILLNIKKYQVDT